MPPKNEISFGVQSMCYFFLSGDTNIGLFSIALDLVIALQILQLQKLSLLSSLIYLSRGLYIDWWLLFCLASNIVIALPTIAIVVALSRNSKRKGKLIALVFLRVITVERKIKERNLTKN